MESGKESTSAASRIHAFTGLIYVSVPASSKNYRHHSRTPLASCNAAAGQRRISSGRPEEHQLCFGAHSSRFELKEDVPLLHYMNVPISAYYYWAWWSAITIFLWRRLYYFTKQTHLCSMIMSKEPIEHLLVKFGLLSRTLLHRIA